MLLTSTFKQIPLTCSKKLHKYISWLERLYPKTQSEKMCVLMEDEHSQRGLYPSFISLLWSGSQSQQRHDTVALYQDRFSANLPP